MTPCPVPLPEQPSIVQLAQTLVRLPSQGGIDHYDPVVDAVVSWLQASGLAPTVLRDPRGEPVAVSCTVQSGRPGRRIVLDACLDTAAVGDPDTWIRPPFSGDIAAGWLHGRGAGDSKTGIAIFAHLAAWLAGRPDQFTGQVDLLLDLDEHTGGFAGVRTFLDQTGGAPVNGVMIGYPGVRHVVVGGRGYWRATTTVHGQAGHTASTSRRGINAITRAQQLAQMLQSAVPEGPELGFGPGPQLTVTGIRGGTPGSWSVIPDRCDLDIDVRLTPTFTEDEALAMVQAVISDLDAEGDVPPCETTLMVESWPAFHLPADHWLPAALIAGAVGAGLHPEPKVAGPSNIGCLLHARGIPATAGFGVDCEGMHAANERIRISSIASVYAAYRSALLSLFST